MKRMLCVTVLLIFCLAGGTIMAQEKPLKVFVLAGQSNMVGARAKAEELPHDLKSEQENVLFFTGREWKPLAPGVSETRGFGPEISFAKRISEKLGEPVGIIKHSVGGTNLAENWSPENPKGLYAALLRKVQNAQKSRKIEIVGMIWLQGGRDAKFKEMAEAYADNLPKLIDRARKDYDSPQMFFIAGRSSLPEKEFPYAGLVRKAQQECAAPRYAWIDCDPIEKGPDDTHYTTAGYVDAGYRFADAMWKMLKPGDDATQKGED